MGAEGSLKPAELARLLGLEPADLARLALVGLRDGAEHDPIDPPLQVSATQALPQRNLEEMTEDPASGVTSSS